MNCIKINTGFSEDLTEEWEPKLKKLCIFVISRFSMICNENIKKQDFEWKTVLLSLRYDRKTFIFWQEKGLKIFTQTLIQRSVNSLEINQKVGKMETCYQYHHYENRKVVSIVLTKIITKRMSLFKLPSFKKTVFWSITGKIQKIKKSPKENMQLKLLTIEKRLGKGGEIMSTKKQNYHFLRDYNNWMVTI